MKIFGTDGVRGVANKDLNIELAQKLGRYAAEVVIGESRGGKVIIGKDTRVSGDMLESAIISGLLSRGADVLRAGVIPTPGVARLVKQDNADLGVVISASHNPAHFNGIKFFDKKGYKISEDLEEKIEGHILGIVPVDESGYDLEREIGNFREAPELHKEYVQYLVDAVGTDLAGFRVAVDCAHGAAFEIAPEVWRRLNGESVCIHCEPDGFNINDGCGSTHPEKLGQIVASDGYQVGFAHDGDADRVIAVDERGKIVDGDQIIAVCAAYLKERGGLRNNLVVSTVMANLGFDLAMRKLGIEVIKTNVGDKYVHEEMEENDAVLGGEQSGHIIFREFAETGDGILTSLMLAKVMKDTGKKLSELTSIIDHYPQVLINVTVKDKLRLPDSVKIWDAVHVAERKLADKGRILVRPSGTEPLVRVMVEALTEEEARHTAGEVARIVQEELA